jgi:hypothetical protein
VDRCLLPTELDAVFTPASATQSDITPKDYSNDYVADADFPDISHAAQSAADRAMVGNRICFVSFPRSSVFAAK